MVYTDPKPPAPIFSSITYFDVHRGQAHVLCVNSLYRYNAPRPERHSKSDPASMFSQVSGRCTTLCGEFPQLFAGAADVLFSGGSSPTIRLIALDKDSNGSAGEGDGRSGATTDALLAPPMLCSNAKP